MNEIIKPLNTINDFDAETMNLKKYRIKVFSGFFTKKQIKVVIESKESECLIVYQFKGKYLYRKFQDYLKTRV